MCIFSQTKMDEMIERRGRGPVNLNASRRTLFIVLILLIMPRAAVLHVSHTERSDERPFFSILFL